MCKSGVSAERGLANLLVQDGRRRRSLLLGEGGDQVRADELALEAGGLGRRLAELAVELVDLLLEAFFLLVVLGLQ